MQLDFVSKEVTSSEWGGGTGTRGAIFLNEVQPVDGARRYLRKELHGQQRAGLFCSARRETSCSLSISGCECEFQDAQRVVSSGDSEQFGIALEVPILG